MNTLSEVLHNLPRLLNSVKITRSDLARAFPLPPRPRAVKISPAMSGQVPIIALLTDFGTTDAYVAAMKGVILTLAPQTQVVDLVHEIDPQNVRQAAYVLLSTYPYFPAHTIFVAVVDPGVGTRRRAIAVETAHGRFLGPDNGLFSYVLACTPAAAIVEITNPAYMLEARSNTFHGRDIFAAAAAHLACGTPIAELGPAVAQIEALPQPRLEVARGQVRGEVIYIDRFGNVITSIGCLSWEEDGALLLTPRFGPKRNEVRFPASSSVSLGRATLDGIQRSYGLAPPGQALALVNSAGQLEVAINQSHAAQTFGVAVGDPVTVRRA
jgi:S-adenosylmethionine hydrolase